MKKVIYIISGLLSICTAVNAGGLLTNTNQNIAFNRNFARDGAILSLIHIFGRYPTNDDNWSLR